MDNIINSFEVPLCTISVRMQVYKAQRDMMDLEEKAITLEHLARIEDKVKHTICNRLQSG